VFDERVVSVEYCLTIEKNSRIRIDTFKYQLGIGIVGGLTGQLEASSIGNFGLFEPLYLISLLTFKRVANQLVVEEIKMNC
jgi:hypothetical protein